MTVSVVTAHRPPVIHTRFWSAVLTTYVVPVSVAAATTAASTRFGVDPYLLAAIVAQESSGNTWATRYEPAYSYLWDIELNAPFHGGLDPAKFPAPDYVSSHTEWVDQKTSFGLCQVIGGVARELGFSGKFLTELCDPAVGAEYGARQIARLTKRYHGQPLEDIASAYNAGHVTNLNPTYVQPVMAFYKQFQATGF